MDYMPVYEDETAGRGAGDVPGHAPFTLSTERQQLIGVTRGTVERRALAVEIRAVGRVAYDPALYQAMVEYREALRSRGAARRAARSAGGARRRRCDRPRRAPASCASRGSPRSRSATSTRAARDPVELLLPGDAVWVYAQVYEYEAPLVAPGQTMTDHRRRRIPGATFAAKVVAIDPILDPTTRTVRVRGLVATPARRCGRRASST